MSEVLAPFDANVISGRGHERMGRGGSHHAWLRELERAQASIVQQIQQSGHSAAKESVAGEQSEVAAKAKPSTAPELVANSLATRSAAVELNNASVNVTRDAAALAAMPGDADSSQTAVVLAATRELRTDVGAIRSSADRVFSATAEHVRYCSSALSLMQTGATTCDVALRDKGMTLESELELADVLRTQLRRAGMEMGQLWVNGKPVYQNSGTKDGN